MADLVARLLGATDIARIVPRLSPEVLQRLIAHTGLEDCAEIVALATPRQLQRVLDVDVWRPPVPGGDEALDAGRFGLWLEVLVQMGEAAGADRLAAMDVDLVIGGLAEHVAVFDAAAVAGYETLDGRQVSGRTFGDGPLHELGGYVLHGRRAGAWDAIVLLLAQLHDDRPGFFQRLMRGLVALSNGGREADGFHRLLDDRDRHRSDLTAAREGRRDRQGYVAPAQARAFLQAARQLALDGDRPPADPIARACLGTLSRPEPSVDPDAGPAGTEAPETPIDAGAVTEVMTILAEAGMITAPRGLLPAADAEDARLTFVRAFLDRSLTAPEDLAFLANAILSGCAVQERPFTLTEAADVVLATCNLGLETWPAAWRDRDLVTAFQIGWSLLHRELGRHAAAALTEVLAHLAYDDREIQLALQTLRRELIRHTAAGEPWRARHALDAVLMLDAPAWAVLNALLDECPTLHAVLGPSPRGRRSVDPGAFTFVARAGEIAVVHAYLETLPDVLAS